jgi:hypothetical protein
MSGVDGVMQADSRADGADAWEGLSDDTWYIVEEMWKNSEEMKAGLRHSQEASGGAGSNLTRAAWQEELSKIQARINALDADAKVPAVKQEYHNFVNKINTALVRDLDAWGQLDARYQGEYGHLSSRKETDFQEAAKALKDRYDDVKRRLDRGAIDYITSEDYLSLKDMLDSKYHIDLGMLRGARNRWKKYQEMLRVVEELKREGEDADKYVPGWSKRTQEEIDHLQTLVNAKITRGGDDYSREFKNIREDLVRRFDDAKRARKPEKSIPEKVVDLVGGGIEAVVGPIIEAANQVVDLVKICMHFASLGNYEPSFTSDMAKAAEQGATTGDLLKGMVTGLIETPERLYKAIEAGDWKAIGRETVNIYMLAKSVREIPDIARRAPAIVSRTARAIRMLKARKLALELHEGKMLPQAAPKAPTQPVPGPELYKVAKSPPKGEPTVLKDPPPPTNANVGQKGGGREQGKTPVKADNAKRNADDGDAGKAGGKRRDPKKADKRTAGEGTAAKKGSGSGEPHDKGGDPAKSKPTGKKQSGDVDGKGPPPKQPVAGRGKATTTKATQEHVHEGGTVKDPQSPYNGKWDGGGLHNWDGLQARIKKDGFKIEKVTEDPVTGTREVTVERVGKHPKTGAEVKGKVTKTVYPKKMKRAEIDAAGERALQDSLNGAPNTKLDMPGAKGTKSDGTPVDGYFEATVPTGHGDSLRVQGWFKKNADGTFEVTSHAPTKPPKKAPWPTKPENQW